jgi:hypothetical protein
MNITCPNNPNHDRFKVSVEVCEEWIVDPSGDFDELHSTAGENEPIRKPGMDDDYECIECGAYGKTSYA